MKTRKLRKFLMLLASALMLVSVTVGATVAYLTDTASVTNTFTVGKVGLTLDEAKVNTDGTYVTDSTNRGSDNVYHLIPGKTYIKDPTVHIAADSEKGILFVKVENGIADIEDETDTIAAQMAARGWKALDGVANVYYHEELVQKSQNIIVFDHFTIGGNVTKETLAAYADNVVKVTAYLIQAEGFVKDGVINYTGAWTAAPDNWKDAAGN